ncbi:relaxase/mobilization nuclease domain-containing protein [Gordonia amicalis]|uniref:relaxase/mobilization nuclease domain-containing protein n=1 Tax=Gordonia amicalis TaxID=89053 RepID=UPI002954E0EB|nr:relaxase/mobilization nuclease domain-containing protein [Gordonia amicalis]MDV7171947.1 relaxase/mobilization nuclease domain-containing protein [Gordonia amicalis]
MTTLSGSALPYLKGFDTYIASAAAHDQDRPGGPSARVEYTSTVGDCAPETYVGDVLRTRLAYGKSDLEIDAYSYVLSHSHEELDPADDDMGAVAHGLARAWAEEAWPGRQVKIVTQRDNGRWEGGDDNRAWVEGHWHSHIVVANVAEEPVTLRWTDAKGIEKTKTYAAGRAIDGDLKNIFRLRRVTDDVVMREWKYDNAAYIEKCQKISEGSAAKQDLAQRAERGYSTYDEVRVKLRAAASQAADWDDYVARCQSSAVDVRVRGTAGVSYSWVGDDGLERKARARGKTGIGPEFTRAEVEARCAANAATLARGQTLAAPEPTLVVPTSTVGPDRPRPRYFTADGRPPWEQDEADYASYVRQTGGTYEGRAAQAVATGEAVAGVTLTRDTDDRVTAAVDAGAGPMVVDVDPTLAARVHEVESREAAVARAEARAAKTIQSAQDDATTLRRQARADEAARVRTEWAAIRPQLIAEAEAAGRQHGQAAWERDERPALVTAARVEGFKRGHAEGRQEVTDELEAAREARRAAAEQLREISGLTPEEAAERVLDEHTVKARVALTRYRVPKVAYDADGTPHRVTGADGKPAITTAWDQMKTDVARGPGRAADVTVGQARRAGRQARQDLASHTERVHNGRSRDTNSRDRAFGE